MATLRQAAEIAIEAAGGGAALARMLNSRRQAIYQWKRVPADHVLSVERFSGIPRHILRPDLYPSPIEPLSAPEPERAA